MRTVRFLLLVPALTLLVAGLVGLVLPDTPEPRGDDSTLMILTLVGHAVLLIGGAICTGLYARRLRFEVAKWVVAAVFFPYVTPAILFFYRVRDPWVEEFGVLFQEHCLAETQRTLVRGRELDPAAIAAAAVEHSTAELTRKYHLTPQEVAGLAESFVRKNSI